MTITLELPSDLEARFLAEAKAKGVPIADVVKSYLRQSSPVRTAKPLSAQEIDAALDEAASLIPDTVPPLSDEAMSRESIYTREDDWNR